MAISDATECARVESLPNYTKYCIYWHLIFCDFDINFPNNA